MPKDVDADEVPPMAYDKTTAFDSFVDIENLHPIHLWLNVSIPSVGDLRDIFLGNTTCWRPMHDLLICSIQWITKKKISLQGLL